MTAKVKRERLIGGIISTLIGVFILLLSLNVIPLDEKAVHAPIWVLASVGLIFLFAGLALFARRESAVTLFFVALLLTLMALMMTWITVAADPGSIKGGGSSFLLGVLDQITGRLLFGIGALLVWVFAFHTWKSFIGRLSSGSKV